MSTASKRKGSAWEIALENYLLTRGYPARRMPLAGINDRGDIEIDWTPDGFCIIEAKAENRIDLPGYLRELDRERVNYAKYRSVDPSLVDGVVVIKRRMAPVGKAFVVTTVDEYFKEPG